MLRKAHSISKLSNKFPQEIDIHDETIGTVPILYRQKKSKEKLKMKE